MHPHFSEQDFLAFSRQHQWHLDEGFAFQLDNGTRVEVLDTGVIRFEPSVDTTTDLVLSSGVHGNETAPIEICNDFINDILAGKLLLDVRVLFIFGNPAAMNIGERFVEENMNRLFSGAHSQGPGLCNRERIRAQKLEGYVADFFNAMSGERERLHYDLHTAIRGSKNEKFVVYPFTHGKAYSKKQMQFLLACGVNTVLLSHAPTTTFSYFSVAQFGAHAFTVELGKVRPFGQNDMTRFIEVKQTLSALLSGDDLQLAEYQASDFNVFEVLRAIDKHHDDFNLHFAEDVVNFTSFPVGFMLASEGDKKYCIEQPGEAVVFPNAKVANGQRAVLMVVPTTVEVE